MNEYIIYADGFMPSKKEKIGGCSYAVFNNDKKIIHIKRYINKIPKKYKQLFDDIELTNNAFEYFALISALLRARKILKENKSATFIIYMDSEVVVKQINGLYLVSSVNLKKLNLFALDIFNEIASNTDLKVIWIKRNRIVEILGH